MLLVLYIVQVKLSVLHSRLSFTNLQTKVFLINIIMISCPIVFNYCTVCRTSISLLVLWPFPNLISYKHFLFTPVF